MIPASITRKGDGKNNLKGLKFNNWKVAVLNIWPYLPRVDRVEWACKFPGLGLDILI